jgi:hypothetical protein
MAGRRKPVPPALEALRQRFEDWRSASIGKSRIPDSLWNAAVKISRDCGVCMTARECRLNSDTLKKRVEHGTNLTAAKPQCDVATRFVELGIEGDSASSELVLELEERGVKLRLAVKGASAPDLSCIVAAFRSKRR